MRHGDRPTLADRVRDGLNNYRRYYKGRCTSHLFIARNHLLMRNNQVDLLLNLCRQADASEDDRQLLFFLEQMQHTQQRVRTLNPVKRKQHAALNKLPEYTIPRILSEFKQQQVQVRNRAPEQLEQNRTRLFRVVSQTSSVGDESGASSYAGSPRDRINSLRSHRPSYDYSE